MLPAPKEVINNRIRILFAIASCIIFDAVLFCIWFGIAWMVDLFSAFLKNQGVHEYFALTFKWLSSCATLVLTIIYIIRDIVEAYRTTFKTN